jgi:Dolichyl-phosphate-mannose-protein mannosyltransferase
MTATAAPPRAVAPSASTSPARRTPNWYAWSVGAALLMGLALRIAIGLTDDAPATDETAYLRSGLSIWNGDGFTRGGQAELHFPPFVPFLLGGLDRIFTDPHLGTVWLTIVCGALLVIPLAALARRVAGRNAGIATAWIAALAPVASTTLTNRGAGSEAVYTLLIVTGLWCTVVAATTDRPLVQAAGAVGAGTTVALAYLTRPEALFIAVPFAVVLAAAVVREKPDIVTRARSLVIAGACFGIPIALAIVPYAMYLHDNTGKWELTAKTQDASIEAWHAVARADREARDEVLYELDPETMEFVAGRSSLTALAREDPSGYLGILHTNARMLGETVVVPETDRFLEWLLLPAPLWLLVGYGAWRFRRSRTLWLIGATAALPVLTALAFFVQPRYLVLPAALAIVPLAAGLFALPRRIVPVAAAGVLALCLLSSVSAFKGPGGWGHPADNTDQREAGEWIAANIDPDDRVMARGMVTEFYADRDTIAIPYADLDTILEYADYYGTQYIAIDSYTVRRLRPQLRPLMSEEELPGLRLVYQARAEGRRTRVWAVEPAPPHDRPLGPSLGFTGDGGS